MRRLVSITLLVLGVCCCAGQSLRADPKVDEQALGPVAAGATYVVSPHGVHLATVAPKGSRMIVVVDGVAGPKFDAIITSVFPWVDPRTRDAATGRSGTASATAQPVAFSYDGAHYAYVGRAGEEWVLMADGKELARVPGAGAAGNTDVRIQFTGDDGKHLLMARSTNNGYELWVDGQKWPGFYSSGGSGVAATDPLVTPDGTRIAYAAHITPDKSTVVVDGKDAGYQADGLQWTTDGKHLVAVASSPQGQQLLVDGKSLFKAHNIYGVYVAPVTNRMIAVLLHQDSKTGNGQFLLVDGKPVPASLSEQIKKVIFSPDGKRYAAIGGKAGAEFVVIDGKKGQEYQVINNAEGIPNANLTFSPDSRKVVYEAMANGKWFIVTDDDESDAFNNLPNCVFSADGKHQVISGMQASNPVLSIDGKVMRRAFNQAIFFPSFTFSPDNSRYATLYATGDPRSGGPVLLDGAETGVSGTFLFSPDSKHVAMFGSKSADNQRGAFLDGKLAARFDTTTIYCAFTPDSQHLYWLTRGPATRKDAPLGTYEFVTYLDGKPVARCDHRPDIEHLLLPTGFGQFTTTPPSWDVSPDGCLVTLAFTDDGAKRLKITPSADTNLATMLADAQAAEDKSKPGADTRK